MKLLGAMLIFGATTGIGVGYDLKLGRSIYILEQLIRFLQLLKEEISYGKSDLPECCFRLADTTDLAFGQTLEAVYRNCERGYDSKFSVVFMEHMEKRLESEPLNEKERKVFYGFLRENSPEEYGMQTSAIERIMYSLEEMLAMKKQKRKEKGRLWMELGALAGAFVIVLLI